MLYLIFAIPLVTFLVMGAFALDEWEEEKRKKKEEEERNKRHEEFMKKYWPKS
jgi:hypothetical protein